MCQAIVLKNELGFSLHETKWRNFNHHDLHIDTSFCSETQNPQKNWEKSASALWVPVLFLLFKMFIFRDIVMSCYFSLFTFYLIIWNVFWKKESRNELKCPFLLHFSLRKQVEKVKSECEKGQKNKVNLTNKNA